MSSVTDAICAWDRLTNNISNEEDTNIDMTEAEADLDIIYQYLRKQVVRLRNTVDGNEYLNREADVAERLNRRSEERINPEGGK